MAKFNLGIKSNKGSIENVIKSIEKYFVVPKAVKSLEWKYVAADEKTETPEMIYLPHAFDLEDEDNCEIIADTYCGFGSEEAVDLYEKELKKTKVMPTTMVVYLMSVYISDERRKVKELPNNASNEDKQQHVLDVQKATIKGTIKATADFHVWLNKLQ